MEINLLAIWAEMGLPVRAVVVVLTIQAVACLAVTVDRSIMLLLSRMRTRAFVRKASEQGGVVDPVRLHALAKEAQGSHLASFVERGLRAFVELVQKGQSRERATDLTRRALERNAEPLSRDLNKGMNVLASTGSTAPFVGLLGTVLGIIHAFKLIAASGSGGIGTIGAAIGEALIVTGYGLAIAIPVTLLFNWLSGRLTAYEGDILNAAGDLLDRLEIGESAVEAAKPAQVAAESGLSAQLAAST